MARETHNLKERPLTCELTCHGKRNRVSAPRTIKFDAKEGKYMDRKTRFPVRKYESLEAMKDEEYRYWQQRPACERIAAVSDITTEAYRLKDPAFHVSRLQRALVAVHRAQG